MWRLGPAFVACLLLAAHFLRWGKYGAVAVCFFIPSFALVVRRRWSLRLLQGLLGLGTLVWMQAGVRFGVERLQHGEPWMRMAVILGSVAGFSAVAAWLLEQPPVLSKYQNR
ncbi:MAG: hypothetical protein WC969_08190 [Elusimicrobiota bacterium]|jgi:hypothetical protein